MCGGFKPSRKFAVAKDEQIAREMARIAKLRNGFSYSWPLTSGLARYTFGSHARSETLDNTWGSRIEKHVKIEAETFSERNTKDGSYKFQAFNMPRGKYIHAVILTGGELRIVTKQSEGNVKDVHHRMPEMID